MADTALDVASGAAAVVRSHARIATAPNKARTYMIQLCKHFGHKIEAKSRQKRIHDTLLRVFLPEQPMAKVANG